VFLGGQGCTKRNNCIVKHAFFKTFSRPFIENFS